MHLPAYINDIEIVSMGVQLLSPINSRFYSGTINADGTGNAKVDYLAKWLRGD